MSKHLVLLAFLFAACATDPALDSADQALSGAPTIAALSIYGAPPEGGATVLVVGLDFDPLATVTYGGVQGSASYCTTLCTSAPYAGLVTTTPALPEGYVDLVVMNPDGQSATFAGFHVGPAPVIDSFSPSSTRKGRDLTIAGNYFGATPQVAIGGQIALVKSKSPTSLVVTVPKLNAGAYQLSVTNPDRQYAVTQTALTITD
jgi:hypothetical protein